MNVNVKIIKKIEKFPKVPTLSTFKKIIKKQKILKKCQCKKK